MMLTLLFALCCSGWSHVAAAGRNSQQQLLNVELSEDASSYTIWLGGKLIAASSDTFVKQGGKKYSTKDGSLKFVSKNTSHGSDGLGEYTLVKIAYLLANSKPFIASIRTYTPGARMGNQILGPQQSSTVVFAQEFPDGLDDVTGQDGDPNTVSSAFPALRPRGTDGADASGWMAFDGWDCDGKNGGCMNQPVAKGHHVAYGPWNNGTSQLPTGVEAAGPMAVFHSDFTATLVVSAMSSFMVASQEFASTAAPTPPNCNESSFLTNVLLGSGLIPPVVEVNSAAECCARCTQNEACACWTWKTPDEKDGPRQCMLKSAANCGSGTAYPHDARVSGACRGSHQPGAMQYGLLGSVTSVPKGFKLETVLHATPTGPVSAVRSWGSLLVTLHGKNVTRSNGDFLNTHLGYDTDNGAYYYYKTEPNKTYEETLIDVKHHADALGIPFRHVQIDSWWYIKGADNGVKTWVPMPGIFPHGIEYMHKETGWPITAHNRMWSGDTTYAQANGGQYPFHISDNMSVPLSQDFWNALLINGTKWGLQMYEQDWLYSEFVGVGGALLQSATLATQWMTQMATGVRNAGITMQLCMAWPRMLLQSLEMGDVVTQARASPDYKPGNDQWRVGDASLFIDALGLRPTKDSFRSTAPEAFPRLQAAVSSLSAGPVFASDEIGHENVPLIMRACMLDGVLLLPSNSAVPTDKCIATKAGVLNTVHGVPTAGEIWRAEAFIGDTMYPQVIVADAPAYNLTRSDILGNALLGMLKKCSCESLECIG
eukprot:m.726077 g.726077  ORF g.726077 m.726077 type:complete len:768 (-) comp23028_c0_seq53:2351-4654(-)